MDKLISNVLGNDGIAEVAGEKVGDIVEDTVKKVLGGGSEKKEEKGEGGEFNVGDALSLVTGKKEGGEETAKRPLQGLFG